MSSVLGSSWLMVLSPCPVPGDKRARADSMSRNQGHCVCSINRKQPLGRASRCYFWLPCRASGSVCPQLGSGGSRGCPRL